MYADYRCEMSAATERTPCSKSVDGEEAGDKVRMTEDACMAPVVEDLPPTSERGVGEVQDSGATLEEPPEDWLKPLEDDEDAEETEDGQSWEKSHEPYVNGIEDEMESAVSESKMSGSMTSTERNVKKMRFHRRGRPRHHELEEDWEDCPVLGEGWMRKEVFRRSGFSMGKTDTYYISPTGERIRSKIELARCFDGSLDLSTFDFKSGELIGSADGSKRGKRKARGGFTSELQLLDQNLTSDVGCPVRRLQVKREPEFSHSLMDTSVATPSPVSTPDMDAASYTPSSASQSLLYTCANCDSPFSALSLDGWTSLCPKCRPERKLTERGNVTFRKWLPCGQCRACLVTQDCGACASCRNGLQNHKPIHCRRRKCLCPIRKTKSQFPPALLPVKRLDDVLVADPRRAQVNDTHSDSDELLRCMDDDDDDDDDDDEDFNFERGPKKRKRRSCGKCAACCYTKDCGTCDFCIDKPKFGGSNKKRQKCRLRQCERQAMRHLLPLGADQGEQMTSQDWNTLGLPKKNRGRGRPCKKGMAWDNFSDDEEYDTGEASLGYTTLVKRASPQVTQMNSYADHSSNCKQGAKSWEQSKTALMQGAVIKAELVAANGSDAPTAFPNVGQPSEHLALAKGDSGLRQDLQQDKEPVNNVPTGSHVQDITPMITQTFSLAESPELLELLETLHKTQLPVHWVGLMREGPQVQLVQCSKLSTMADTVLHIHPGFHYEVSVQGQPLLLTHPLYESHPARLATADDVVALLQDLERHSVCQGMPLNSTPTEGPWLCTRAATCDFLVLQGVERCSICCL